METAKQNKGIRNKYSPFAIEITEIVTSKARIDLMFKFNLQDWKKR